MSTENLQIEAEWKAQLSEEFQKDYMVDLKKFIRAELSKGKTIYPHGRNIFNALNFTPFSKVKVVVLGQDPYHGPGQAHGLCFSVPKSIPAPPSLVNIFKEIQDDLGESIPRHGNLESWAEQGVLLLNTVLTVEKGKAASHRDRGWERLTDKIIESLSEREEPIVFLLWGSFAQKKAEMIKKHHYILKAPHPSPLSAHRGFMGCKHFSKTNKQLQAWDRDPINWSLPN